MEVATVPRRGRPARAVAVCGLRLFVVLFATIGIAATPKILNVDVCDWWGAGARERSALMEGAASDEEQVDAVIAIQRRIEADLLALELAEARGGFIAEHARNARHWTHENSR